MIAEHVTRSSRRTGTVPNDAPRTARVALLGCGTVGREVARLLIHHHARIATNTGIDLKLIRVLVRDADRARDVRRSLITTDIDDVLRDDPDFIIELLGGVNPAAKFIEAALERGISVVSANKTVIAHKGSRLRVLAARHGATLAYESAVGSAIPIIAALRQRAGDSLRRIQAVLNGSCNFILTHMAEAGCDLSAALRRAVELGVVEHDPSADVSGRDSAEKLCIIAAEAGLGDWSPQSVPTSGIETITLRDLEAARACGCVIKLIAEIDAAAGSVNLCVGPTFIPRRHPLATATGVENVFVLQHELAGTLVLRGQGAGPVPTAATVIGDLLTTISEPQEQAFRHGFAGIAGDVANRPLAREVKSQSCFVRLTCGNRVLTPSAVLDALREHGIETMQIAFREQTVEAVTRPTTVEHVHRACQRLDIAVSSGLFVAPIIGHLDAKSGR
jgi:homoserine dehydrogenase